MKRAAVAVLFGFYATSYPAQAETLYDAFATAFAGNEVLGSQRAAVRVSEQDEVIAKTGYAPSVDSTYDYGYDDLKGKTPTTPTSDSKTHPRGYGLSLSENLFNGFKTTRTVAREDASLQSERDKLGDVEQTVLVDVAAAYLDVIRDKAIVELHRHDRELLEARAQQTRYRFQIGDLTRTDVDQSEAALARSQADLIIAQTNLEASAAVYQSVVGHDPGKLEPAAIPERLLPHDLGSALAIADAEHPAIQAALRAVQAAELNIDVERASFAPSLDLTASTQRRWDPELYPAKTELTENTVVGRLTIPLYDRGLTYASVHRASELATQAQLQLDHRRILIRSSVIQNRNTFLAAKAVIASADAQIAASARALAGVELEATAGQRTTLDVLTAQSSLLDARVNREIAQHDRIIAGYRFLASIGRLSVSHLSAEDTRGRAPRPSLPLPMPVEPALDRFPFGWQHAADASKSAYGSIRRVGVATGPGSEIGRFPDKWMGLYDASPRGPQDDHKPAPRPSAKPREVAAVTEAPVALGLRPSI